MGTFFRGELNMNGFVLFCFLGIFNLGCKSVKEQVKSPTVQAEYMTPKPASYLGMSSTDFAQKRDVAAMEKFPPPTNTGGNDLTVLVETVGKNQIQKIQYQFLHQKLYQIILFYEQDVDVQKKAEEQFGKPNLDNGKWKVKGKGIPFYVWIHKKNLSFGDVRQFPNIEPKPRIVPTKK